MVFFSRGEGSAILASKLNDPESNPNFSAIIPNDQTTLEKGFFSNSSQTHKETQNAQGAARKLNNFPNTWTNTTIQLAGHNYNSLQEACYASLKHSNQPFAENGQNIKDSTSPFIAFMSALMSNYRESMIDSLSAYVASTAFIPCGSLFNSNTIKKMCENQATLNQSKCIDNYTLIYNNSCNLLTRDNMIPVSNGWIDNYLDTSIIGRYLTENELKALLNNNENERRIFKPNIKKRKNVQENQQAQPTSTTNLKPSESSSEQDEHIHPIKKKVKTE